MMSLPSVSAAPIKPGIVANLSKTHQPVSTAKPLSARSRVRHQDSPAITRLNTIGNFTTSRLETDFRLRASNSTRDPVADPLPSRELLPEELLIIKYLHVYAGSGGLFNNIKRSIRGSKPVTSNDLTVPISTMKTRGNCAAAGSNSYTNRTTSFQTRTSSGIGQSESTRQRRAVSAVFSNRPTSSSHEMTKKRPETAVGLRSRSRDVYAMPSSAAATSTSTKVVRDAEIVESNRTPQQSADFLRTNGGEFAVVETEESISHTSCRPLCNSEDSGDTRVTAKHNELRLEGRDGFASDADESGSGKVTEWRQQQSSYSNSDWYGGSHMTTTTSRTTPVASMTTDATASPPASAAAAAGGGIHRESRFFSTMSTEARRAFSETLLDVPPGIESDSKPSHASRVIVSASSSTNDRQLTVSRTAGVGEPTPADIKTKATSSGAAKARPVCRQWSHSEKIDRQRPTSSRDLKHIVERNGGIIRAHTARQRQPEVGDSNDEHQSIVELSPKRLGHFRITSATYDSRYDDLVAAAALDGMWRQRDVELAGRWDESLDDRVGRWVRELAIIKCSNWLNGQQTGRESRKRLAVNYGDATNMRAS